MIALLRAISRIATAQAAGIQLILVVVHQLLLLLLLHLLSLLGVFTELGLVSVVKLGVGLPHLDLLICKLHLEVLHVLNSA